MNRSYPPDNDDWQECEENTQQPVHPVTSPKVLGPASTSANYLPLCMEVQRVRQLGMLRMSQKALGKCHQLPRQMP